MRLLNITVMSGENGFTKAMRTICDQYEEADCARANLNHRICDVADRMKPDLVFIQIQAVGITDFTLQRLGSLGAYIINWSGDVRYPLPDVYLQMAKHVDITCFSNMNDVEEMRSRGFAAEFLQIGYDPEIYNTTGPVTPSPDIVFMGNNFDHFPLSQYRRDMVGFLQRAYGSRFGVYGIGWQGAAGNYMGDQEGEAAVYRGAKIGINLSHFDYKRYTSDRMFRMMGTSITVISHDFTEVYRHFYEGKHLLLFDSMEQLKDRIDYLLDNDEKRTNIAQNGHQLALNNYTFQHMAENIRRIYDER